MNLGFISDLHLSETDTSLTNAFVDFLKSHSSNLDQLYILGDLYEVWIGDDDSSSLITSTKDALSKASKGGISSPVELRQSERLVYPNLSHQYFE